MTSRRLIRIKVLQLLYSYTQKEGVSLAEIERDLLKSISKSSDLYYQTLLLLTEIRHTAFIKIDNAKNRRFASNVDLNPNIRFVDNPILTTIQKNKKFQSYINNNKISWNDMQDVVTYFYNKIIESHDYDQYMRMKEPTFDDHKKIIIDIFTEIITQDDMFFQALEEKSIFWNDDFELVLSIVYKTMKNIGEESQEDENIFYPIYNLEEDTDFAKKLMRKTILENNENLNLIDKFTQNWEIERISEIDKLIMSAAIAELKHFPSIPVKVTLDEYIEIAKSYSSPKSGSFINGILDKAFLLLKENNEITKIGRGLME